MSILPRFTHYITIAKGACIYHDQTDNLTTGDQIDIQIDLADQIEGLMWLPKRHIFEIFGS